MCLCVHINVLVCVYLCDGVCLCVLMTVLVCVY